MRRPNSPTRDARILFVPSLVHYCCCDSCATSRSHSDSLEMSAMPRRMRCALCGEAREDFAQAQRQEAQTARKCLRCAAETANATGSAGGAGAAPRVVSGWEVDAQGAAATFPDVGSPSPPRGH